MPASEDLERAALATPAIPRATLGRFVAVVPNTEQEVPGVRLSRYDVRVEIENGFAHTEIEQEFYNATDRVLEGRFEFSTPMGASISRLGLWVGSELVEGAMVERRRAREIFDAIVRRELDPALLERQAGGKLSLRVFPVPARQSRRVLIAYDEALPKLAGKRGYSLPLTHGPGAPPIDQVAIEVRLAGVDPERLELAPNSAATIAYDRRARLTSVRWSARDWTASEDFFVRYGEPDAAPRLLVHGLGGHGSARKGSGFFALRVRAASDERTALPASARAIVIDRSHGQHGQALATAKRLAGETLRSLPVGSEFVLFACDSACSSFPASGVSRATPSSLAAAARFIEGLEAAGASDVVASLAAGLERVGERRRPQVVYIGSARATAGTLDARKVAELLRTRAHADVDLRLVGIGRDVDLPALEHIARSAPATLALYPLAFDHDAFVEETRRALFAPVVRDVKLEFSGAVSDVHSLTLPNLSAGDEALVLGRIATPLGARATLSGTLDGHAFRAEQTFDVAAQESGSRAIVPRLWAEAQLRALETNPNARDEVVRLSKRYHVMSQHTSLLVLENEAMFRDHDVERTAERVTFAADAERGARRASPLPPRRVHVARVPRIRASVTTVSGRMPPEAIQRVVRLNFGRLRACYHRALLRAPGLRARVVTRFLIGRDGRVAAAQNAGSLPSDQPLVECVTRVFGELVFPAPEDGVISVVYPVLFTPHDANEVQAPAELPVARSVATKRPPPPPVTSEQRRPHDVAESAARAELTPTDPEVQREAARAYESVGDELRACAHWRAATILAPDDEVALYESLRCRVRVHGERIGVLAEASAMPSVSESIRQLIVRLHSLESIPRSDRR
jgi:hypothetical protein